MNVKKQKKEATSLFRYNRQIVYEEFGEDGQRKLLDSSVVVTGCGGLGGVITTTLVRAGVGRIKIVDHDSPSLDNLHRQILFDEDDLSSGLSKPQIAAQKLRKMNSQVQVDFLDTFVNAANINKIIKGTDLVLDGTDNFESRMLLNDACVKQGIPWIYTGVMATYGTIFFIIPGETACLRCFMRELPDPELVPRPAAIGVMPTAVNVLASIEANEAIKFLAGKKEALIGKLINIDIWNGTWENFEIDKQPDCPACSKRHFDFLEKKPGEK